MLERIREARANESGFTLIELLIVVVILGVLAGVVVFGVSAFNNQGVTAACKSDAKNVEIANQAYYAQTGGYAADAATLVTGGFLKSAPNSTKYKITISPNDVVTGLLSDGVTSCYP